MPPRLAVTFIAQIIRGVGADGVVGTRVGGAGCEDFSTSGPAVRQLAQTGETGHAVHTGSFIQTGTGRTLVDVHLAKVTSEALATFAGEPVELVDAGAGVLARTRQTVISVQITVLSHPSRFTVTAITIDIIPACAMNTGAAATLVHLGVTVGGLEPLRTLAVESIFFIHTRPSIPAGAGGALVDLHITLGTCEARFAHTVVTVDAVFADSVVTWVAGTIIKVDLTVCT